MRSPRSPNLSFQVRGVQHSVMRHSSVGRCQMKRFGASLDSSIAAAAEAYRRIACMGHAENSRAAAQVRRRASVALVTVVFHLLDSDTGQRINYPGSFRNFEVVLNERIVTAVVMEC